jgi:hypothetical protein
MPPLPGVLTSSIAWMNEHARRLFEHHNAVSGLDHDTAGALASERHRPAHGGRVVDSNLPTAMRWSFR